MLGKLNGGGTSYGIVAYLIRQNILTTDCICCLSPKTIVPNLEYRIYLLQSRQSQLLQVCCLADAASNFADIITWSIPSPIHHQQEHPYPDGLPVNPASWPTYVAREKNNDW